MGEAARQKMIEEFDREKVAAAYLEEIHAAMEEPKKDGGKKGNSETRRKLHCSSVRCAHR